MAHLLWRKQNLSTYRLANEAKKRISAIQSRMTPQPKFHLAMWMGDPPDPEETRNAREELDALKKELGDFMQLVELGNLVTTDYLGEELSVIDRLDGMIERCLKRLLMVRGIKSISASATTQTSSSIPARSVKRIAAA
jgi:hypothetical protein